MSRPLNRLRATRAAPPGLAAGDDDRRAVLSASLQQAEDLFEAAAAIGPFARPLPLFYAVSQAGRAVAAARTEGKWRVRGHGLSEVREGAGSGSDDILRFRLERPENAGIFGAVASIFDLPGLTASVELGGFWSALPGLDPPNSESWPLALPVWPQLYRQNLTLLIGASHRAHVCIRDQAPPDDAEAINDLLVKYPRAVGAQVEVAQGLIQHEPTPWGPGVPVKWPAPSVEALGKSPPPAELLESQVHNRVPEYRYRREHWLVPLVGDGNDELPPLLLWWGLLFGLSLLARYEPVVWRSALDPDQSQLAVPLEELLDEALVIAPTLLAEAITGELALLPARA